MEVQAAVAAATCWYLEGSWTVRPDLPDGRRVLYAGLMLLSDCRRLNTLRAVDAEEAAAESTLSLRLSGGLQSVTSIATLPDWTSASARETQNWGCTLDITLYLACLSCLILLPPTSHCS